MLKDNTTYIIIICENEAQSEDLMDDISIEFRTARADMEIQGNELLIPILKDHQYGFSVNKLEEFVSPRILNMFDSEYQEFLVDGVYRVDPVRHWHTWSHR